MKALNSSVVALASLVSVALAGCADVGTGADEGEGASVQTAEEALTVNGQTVNWTYVGNPWAASRIAACPGYANVLYALNNDYRLYKGNGSDSGWSYRGYPSAARDIACTDPGWVWALNADKKFYYSVYSGDDSHWVYEGTASGAEQFGTGSMITALNYDDRVYSYDNYTKKWTYNATFAGATEASSVRIGSSATLRWFVVKDGTVHFTTGNSLALTAFPLVDNGVTKTVREVSAATSDVILGLDGGSKALQGDVQRDLLYWWRGQRQRRCRRWLRQRLHRDVGGCNLREVQFGRR
ncbi:MAG: hypothetical protein QM784_25200 [Polyangiaceae bacterium]